MLTCGKKTSTPIKQMYDTNIANYTERYGRCIPGITRKGRKRINNFIRSQAKVFDIIGSNMKWKWVEYIARRQDYRLSTNILQ